MSYVINAVDSCQTVVSYQLQMKKTNTDVDVAAIVTDVGVSFLAVLNVMKILKYKTKNKNV